ncbi:MAG: superoxide dismutase family protein [Pedobacter sp.]|nr:MAG: superoxide dismutase family protein [Pedobacter sp.]
MKKYFVIGVACVATFFASCSKTEQQIGTTSLLSTANNQSVGSASFFSTSDGEIKMDIEITMPERADSTVAVHFHEHGDCGNMGENTHGHWNPTNEAHGKWGSDAYHSGDIGNISLDGKGHATLSVTTDRWSTADGDVKNIIGKGIIVHGGTDDYKTQPTGNSGPRVGCGIIEAVNSTK